MSLAWYYSTTPAPGNRAATALQTQPPSYPPASRTSRFALRGQSTTLLGLVVCLLGILDPLHVGIGGLAGPLVLTQGLTGVLFLDGGFQLLAHAASFR